MLTRYIFKSYGKSPANPGRVRVYGRLAVAGKNDLPLGNSGSIGDPFNESRRFPATQMRGGWPEERAASFLLLFVLIGNVAWASLHTREHAFPGRDIIPSIAI